MFNLIAAALMATSFIAGPASADMMGGSAALKTLATTGFADDYAAEVGGLAFDETGGKPGAFEYALPVDLTAARDLVASTGTGEFLAPHIAVSPNGDITVMVAPHLFVGGELMKGANAQKDNYIVISGGVAERFDYSVKFEGM